MKRSFTAVSVLVLISYMCTVTAAPLGGPTPGLKKLIQASDAIVVLRIDRHLSDFVNADNFYSTHECYIYQTIKGDIPKNAHTELSLRNTMGSFATPYAHGSTHLMFLMKRAHEDEKTEYRTITFSGAQVLLAPLGHEKAPKGASIEEKLRTLIESAIAYHDEEHKKRQAFLKTILRPTEP